MLLAASVACGALWAGSRAVRAASAQDPVVATGIRQVEEGDFEGALVTLTPAADRLAAVGGRDAAQACLYLGIAQLALGQVEDARARFVQALGHEPSLRLQPDRVSPKVLSAFEEARRERDAATRASAPGASAPKKSRAGRTVLLAGAGIGAGVGIALVAGGGDSTTPSGDVQFAGARFGTPVLDCPNGTVGLALPVAIDLNAENGTGRDVTVASVSAVLFIVASPAVPGEVGFSTSPPATVVPVTLRPGTTALRVQTTLTCANGEGDAPRYNEWKGRVTLTTAGGAQSTETADTLRVNLP